MLKKNIFLVFSTLLFVLYYFHPIPLQGTNVDLGHHLLLGEIIVKTQTVPKINLLSYTYEYYPYVNTHWMSDVIFYLTHLKSGFYGLQIFTASIIGLTSLLLLKTVGRVTYSPLIFAGTFFYLQALSDRTEIKPEILSFLLLGITLSILYKFRKKYTRLIFLLPATNLIWVNSHIYFIVGIAVTILFLVENLVVARGKFDKSSKTLSVVIFLSLLATLINPNLLEGALFPFAFLNNYGYKVIENLNFFDALREHGNITFAYIFASWSLLTVFIVANKKRSLIDIFLVILFTFLAFFAVRNFALFVVGTLVPFLRLGSEYLKDKSTVKRQVITVIIVVLSVPGFIYSLSIHGVGFGVLDQASRAVNFLRVAKVNGLYYNNYNIGNYLEYKIYPQKVFVDGRPEAYPKSFFVNEYYPSERGGEAFERVAKKYGFTTVFYEHKNQTTSENPLLGYLSGSKDWKLVYLDSSIIIFIKNDNLNKEIIRKYSLKPDQYRVADIDLLEKDKIRQYSNLFRVLGWYDNMVEMDKEYLKFDPTNCVALRHVAAVMQSTNNPQASYYISEYTKHCPL